MTHLAHTALDLILAAAWPHGWAMTVTPYGNGVDLMLVHDGRVQLQGHGETLHDVRVYLAGYLRIARGEVPWPPPRKESPMLLWPPLDEAIRRESNELLSEPTKSGDKSGDEGTE